MPLAPPQPLGGGMAALMFAEDKATLESMLTHQCSIRSGPKIRRSKSAWSQAYPTAPTSPLRIERATRDRNKAPAGQTAKTAPDTGERPARPAQLHATTKDYCKPPRWIRGPHLSSRVAGSSRLSPWIQPCPPGFASSSCPLGAIPWKPGVKGYPGGLIFRRV